MISILLNTSTHKKSWWIVFIWKQQSYLSGDIGSNFIFLLYVILFWGFFSGCVNLLKLHIVNVLCLKYVCSGSSCSVIKFVSPWLSFKTFCNLAQLTLFPTLSKHKYWPIGTPWPSLALCIHPVPFNVVYLASRFHPSLKAQWYSVQDTMSVHSETALSVLSFRLNIFVSSSVLNNSALNSILPQCYKLPFCKSQHFCAAICPPLLPCPCPVLELH